MPGAHKIGAAFSGPRITGGKITDIRLVLSLRPPEHFLGVLAITCNFQEWGPCQWKPLPFFMARKRPPKKTALTRKKRVLPSYFFCGLGQKKPLPPKKVGRPRPQKKRFWGKPSKYLDPKLADPPFVWGFGPFWRVSLLLCGVPPCFHRFWVLGPQGS